MFCFIGWVVYRSLKRSNQRGRKDNSKDWISKLAPWRRRTAMSNVQASGSSYEPNEPLPAYDVGNNNSIEPDDSYSQGKLYAMGSEGMTHPSAAALQAERVTWQTTRGQPTALVYSSNQYQQANGRMIDSSNINSTSRSQMLGPYYNQPAFARQPSNAHNPTQRQVYRASEGSSLSSGFGDGDIIMPPPDIVYKPPIAQATNTDTSHRPFSWMSRAGTEKRRDTVSTTTSDRPTHFRSINSWVDQQKERLRRANSRAGAREDVPVMPAMPSRMSQISTTQQLTSR